MIARDEDALICDFAEVYHIYNLYELPPNQVAILACGLSEDSRIMMSLSGSKIDTKTYLLGMAVDALEMLLWAKTDDGQKGKNPPKSVVNALLGIEEEKNANKDDVMTFETPEDFLAYRESLASTIENPRKEDK